MYTFGHSIFYLGLKEYKHSLRVQNVEIFLLLPLLPLRRGREVVEGRTPVSLLCQELALFP